MMARSALSEAVERWLAKRSGADRREGAAAMTATYARGGGSGAIDLGAYVASRLPATYAAVFDVLSELARLRPGFAPSSLLDAGAGPGTASWAVATLWPGLRQVTLLDHDPRFLDVARDLAEEGPETLRSARLLRGNLSDPSRDVPADLLVAAYALAELSLADAATSVLRLWEACADVLVVVEPGTPAGFERIRVARTALLAKGAVPVAPCPHAGACPVAGTDWCHFSVRLPRSRAHMHAKRASVPFEDEKFSYLVLARQGAPTGGGRITAPPLHGKAEVSLRLCAQGGLAIRRVARRDRAAYKAARKHGWGDLVDPSPAEEDGQ